jgi:hypothetical protein
MRLIVSTEGFDEVAGHSITALTATNSWFLSHVLVLLLLPA